MSPTPPKPPVRPLPWYWRALEAWFARRSGLRTLDDDPEALLAYNLYHHGGRPVALEGGTVHSGDLVLELHFRREALLPLIAEGDPRRAGRALLRLGRRDLPRLAAALEREPELREVRALHALTLFHRGIQHVGFQVVEMESALACRWFSWWHRLLMARDASTGAARVREHREKLVTRHIWFPREAFLRRYLAGNEEP